ncbi:MAG: TonB-dependent receptor [Pseudomonadota bacterium]
MSRPSQSRPSESRPSNLSRSAFAFSLLSIAVSGAVQAQMQTSEKIEEVVIRAHPLSGEGLAQPVAVLAGDELQRALAGSLGETLQDVPGIHSSSFGQAVGRPVIRGLGGPRVKTTEDRIDSMDVSVSSPDHAVTIDPFIAQSIEVLKGPSTLLYGSGAIGGVVDVHTGRIPHEVPEELTGSAQVRGADNADQQTAAGRIDGGSGNFAFHVDAYYRDADEYDIPGFAESAALRAQEEAEEEDHDDDHGEEGEEEEAFGVLPGSQLEAQGGAIGASYVGERGFFGLAVSTFQAEYGLPGHGHEHGHEDEEHEDEDHDEEHEGEEHEGEEEEGNALLDLDQTRIDLEGALEQPFEGFSSLNFRVGYNDYEHTEFEGNGEAGTVFTNEAWEGRLELTHNEMNGIKGVFGVQMSNREFSAIGEEAFVQPVDTSTIGLFYVGRKTIGEVNIEAGARYENVDHDPSEGASRSFDVGAISLGLSRDLTDNWSLSAQGDVSSRAPVAEELYSNGPHLATQTFEIGDDTLDEEVALNLSADLGYQSERLTFMLSAFATEFTDFIYEFNTGLEEDELPVLQWSQQDATFTGLEGDLTWQAAAWENGGFYLHGGFDTVRARFDGGDNRNIPRISPTRWRVGASADFNGLYAELTYRVTEDQDDVAFGELPTEGFEDLRLRLSYSVPVGSSQVEFFLSGRNLTDDEQRLHTSFIKDVAPLPGRTIEGGIQVQL